MNEENTTTIEAPQPEPTTPIVEEQPSEAVAPEPAVAPEQELQPPPEPDVNQEQLDSVLKSLEVPDEPNDFLMNQIDEDTVNNLPDSAKGVLKHLIAKQNKDYESRLSKFDEYKKEMSEREGRIQQEAKKLIRNRAEMNRVLLDPKFQEFMRQANIPEDEMEDAFTEKGVEQRIAKGVAEAMKEFQKPFAEAAHRSQQISVYQDFVESHPQMKQSGFKKEVRQLMDARREEGRPLGLEDAYAMVDRGRMLREKEAQAEKERTARARSARKISRATMSNSVTPDEPIPKWVKTKGYNGLRGQSAIIHYLRDNPKALEALRAQQKRNRR